MCFWPNFWQIIGFRLKPGGIEIDSKKIKAIIEISTLRTKKEVRGFLEQINYIDRSIAKLTTTCEPLFKVLWKKWVDDMEQWLLSEFDKVKTYLLNPPVLMPLFLS